jgi:hypothetical protein
MTGSFAARENMTMALDDAADLLREHGQHEWATFLQDIIDHAEDDAALARLRRAYDELTELILDPVDADVDARRQVNSSPGHSMSADDLPPNARSSATVHLTNGAGGHVPSLWPRAMRAGTIRRLTGRP